VSDGTGLAEKMLGLADLIVLDVNEHPSELVVTVESARSSEVPHELWTSTMRA